MRGPPAKTRVSKPPAFAPQPHTADLEGRDPIAEVLHELVRRLPQWNDILATIKPLVEDVSLGIMDAREAVSGAALVPEEVLGAVKGTVRGNQPPEPMSPEVLADLLAERHTALIKRRDELLASAARFHKAVPAIQTEDIAGKAVTFVGQFQALAKAAKLAHEPEKSPWLTLGRTVDGFFKNITDPVEAEKKKVEAKQLAFARVVAERKREEAAAEARRVQEAFDRAAEIAADTMTQEALDTAAALAQQAADASALAAASAAEHSRVRGAYGATAGIVTRWKIRPLPEWRGLLSLDFLMPDQTALDAALRSSPRAPNNRPTLTIPGAEVYADESIVNR